VLILIFTWKIDNMTSGHTTISLSSILSFLVAWFLVHVYLFLKYFTWFMSPLASFSFHLEPNHNFHHTCCFLFYAQASLIKLLPWWKFFKIDVTPSFLAPNKPPTKSRVFSKPFRWAHLPPFETPVVLSLPFGARAANPAGTAHTRAIGRRVSPQHRGRPPRRESRARRGPAGRYASPSPPSRN
jgi:hypothetical protein